MPQAVVDNLCFKLGYEEEAESVHSNANRTLATIYQSQQRQSATRWFRVGTKETDKKQTEMTTGESTFVKRVTKIDDFCIPSQGKA